MSVSTVRQRRWTRKDYERVVDAGGFGPEDRIELLDGEIWEMTPQGSRHAIAFELVAARLATAFADIGHVRHQLPFSLDDVSQPEPDVAVIVGELRDYRHAHPNTALLIVEVSDTSLSHDRGRKLAAYARNSIPEYWLLDLTTNRLEVFREPDGEGYRSKMVLMSTDSVEALRAPGALVAVADLLP